LGGAQVHVRDLAVALQKRGNDVSVLAGGGGVLFDALLEHGVFCRKLEQLVHPIKPLRDGAAFREIKTALRDLKPDLVTTHSNKAGLLGRFAARSLNIPVIHTSHGFLFSDSPDSPRGLFYRLMEKIAARAGDKVIAVAESEFKTAESLHVIPAEKLTMVHNGLGEADLPRLQADPALEPPRLVMVARFAAPKDQATLLQALGRLKEKLWTLTLVGDGRGRSAAEKMAGELGLSERVEFLGVREDTASILASSQVFVLSSRREGFPLSILEAMRAGLPVIASDVGGVGEAVEDGKTGFTVPVADVDALSERLGRLIDDPALRQRMGEAGRERFLNRFTLDQMVKKTLAVYNDVLSKRGC